MVEHQAAATARNNKQEASQRHEQPRQQVANSTSELAKADLAEQLAELDEESDELLDQEAEPDEITQATSTDSSFVEADRRFFLEPGGGGKLSDKLKEFKATSSDQLKKQLKRITQQASKRPPKRRRKRKRRQKLLGKPAGASTKSSQHRQGYTTSSYLDDGQDYEQLVLSSAGKGQLASSLKQHLPALQLPSMVQKLIASKLSHHLQANQNEPQVSIRQQHQQQADQAHRHQQYRRLKQQLRQQQQRLQQQQEQQHQLTGSVAEPDWPELEPSSGMEWRQKLRQRGSLADSSQLSVGTLLGPPANLLIRDQTLNKEGAQAAASGADWPGQLDDVLLPPEGHYPSASDPGASQLGRPDSSAREMIPVEIIGLDPTVTNSILFGGGGHEQEAGEPAPSGSSLRQLETGSGLPPNNNMLMRPANQPASRPFVHIHHFHSAQSAKKAAADASSASDEPAGQLGEQSSAGETVQGEPASEQQVQTQVFTNENGQVFVLAVDQNQADSRQHQQQQQQQQQQLASGDEGSQADKIPESDRSPPADYNYQPGARQHPDKQVQVLYRPNNASEPSSDQAASDAQQDPNQALFMVSYRPSAFANATGPTDKRLAAATISTDRQHLANQPKNQLISKQQYLVQMSPSGNHNSASISRVRQQTQAGADQHMVSLAELANRLRASNQFANEPSPSESLGYKSTDSGQRLDLLGSQQLVPANATMYNNDGYTASQIGRQHPKTLLLAPPQGNLISRQQQLSGEEFLSILRGLKAEPAPGAAELNVSMVPNSLLDLDDRQRGRQQSRGRPQGEQDGQQQQQRDQAFNGSHWAYKGGGGGKLHEQQLAAGSLEEVEAGLGNLALAFICVVSLVTLALIAASMVYRHRRRAASRCVDLPERGSRLNLTQRTRHFMSSNFVAPSNASSIKSVGSDPPGGAKSSNNVHLSQMANDEKPPIKRLGLSAIFGKPAGQATTSAVAATSTSSARPTGRLNLACQNNNNNNNNSNKSASAIERKMPCLASLASECQPTRQHHLDNEPRCAKKDATDIRTLNTRIQKPSSYLKSLISSSGEHLMSSLSSKQNNNSQSANNKPLEAADEARQLQRAAPCAKLKYSNLAGAARCEGGATERSHSFKRLDSCNSAYHNANSSLYSDQASGLVQLHAGTNFKRNISHSRPLHAHGQQQALETIHSIDDRGGGAGATREL